MGIRKFGNKSLIIVAASLATVALMIVAATALLPTGLGGASSAPALRVVATTTVFADLAANVAGERAQVTSLIPTGADPHTWEPSTAQAREVANADVFLYNGMGLEPWADRLVANVGRRDLVVVRLSEGLKPIDGVSFLLPGQPSGSGRSDAGAHAHVDDEHSHGEDGDPHFWLDITNAMHYVRRIEQALSAADPAGAGYYRQRAEAYLAELAELDRWFAEQIDRIPPERRVLLTYHDAYGYMANRYGLELVGFVVRNPDREPAPRELADLVRVIRERGVPAIFTEPQVNARFAQTLAREAGVRIGVLYTDALTADVPTYVDMMRANATALVEGLGVK